MCKAQHCIYVLVRQDVQHICAEENVCCAIRNVFGCLRQVSTDLLCTSSFACTGCLHINSHMHSCIYLSVHQTHDPQGVWYMQPEQLLIWSAFVWQSSIPTTTRVDVVGRLDQFMPTFATMAGCLLPISASIRISTCLNLRVEKLHAPLGYVTS